MINAEKHKAIYGSSAQIEQQINNLSRQNQQGFEQIQRLSMDLKMLEQKVTLYEQKRLYPNASSRDYFI